MASTMATGAGLGAAAPSPPRAGDAAAAARAAVQLCDKSARARDEERVLADSSEALIWNSMMFELKSILQVVSSFEGEFCSIVARGREAMETIKDLQAIGVRLDVLVPATPNQDGALQEVAFAKITAALMANHEKLVAALKEAQAMRARTMESLIKPMLEDSDSHVAAAIERASACAVTFARAAFAEEVLKKIEAEIQAELQAEIEL
jgi:hypothetical protein